MDVAKENVALCTVGGGKACRLTGYKHERTRRMVVLHVYSRDCDHVSVEYLTALPANWRVISKWLNDFYGGAEGPCSAYMLHPDEFPEFEGFRRRERDGIMEAYEDGHAHCVEF